MNTDEVHSLLVRTLGRNRLIHPTEQSLQDDLDSRLKQGGTSYSREFRLGPKKRPDFLISDVAVEIKTKGSSSSILRQLKRYSDDPTISGVVLVTLRKLAVPDSLSGKPLRVLELWKNLL